MLSRLKSIVVKFSNPSRSFSSSTVKHPVLPVINSQTPLPHFNQQVFAALSSKGGFVLRNLGDEFSNATTGLFSSYQDFLQQPDTHKKPFEGSGYSTVLSGFYPAKSFFGGSRACNRFFINQNSEGIIEQPLPSLAHSKVSMMDAATDVSSFTKLIFANTVSALQIGLGLQNQELSRVFYKHSILTSLNSYLPVTQQKLLDWQQQGKLSKNASGRIITFLPHKDLTALSVLIYGANKTHGLEVKTPDDDGKLSFKPLSLQSRKPYHIEAIVVAGLIMEHITDGLVKGLEHRVVASPMPSKKRYSREAISSFAIIDPNINPAVKPLICAPGGPHYPIEPMATFFQTHARAYDDTADREAAKLMVTKEDFAPYPNEEEIDLIQTTNGFAYRRR